MRILIISDEVWNDSIHGNNVLTSWFDGFDAEFANIYLSPGRPENKCCKKYFQITDRMMLKSMIGPKKAGEFYEINEQFVSNSVPVENVNEKLYFWLKKLTTETMRAIRDSIWYYGKIDEISLRKFITEFKPEIIFSPRLATIKMLRIEKMVADIAGVPIVAFTGASEYSLKHLRFSPVFWGKKFIMRRKFRAMMPNYTLYYTLSDEQREEYELEFGKKFKILRKCGDFDLSKIRYTSHKPIKLVYAGKLYSNRWRILAKIVKALREINTVECKMVLEIYTKDRLSKRQYRLLNDGRNSILKGPVPAEELDRIYNESDIALHVESFDLKNRLSTKYSFSTKIVDCLASGCAVMVISWDKHSGFTYLKNEDAAFCVSSPKEIVMTLSRICNQPSLIHEYANKALACAGKNHTKEQVQRSIYVDFSKIISERKNAFVL